MGLEVLPGQNGAAAREAKLVRWDAAAAIAFNDNGAFKDEVAVLGHGIVEERPARGRELFLTIRAVLKELRRR